MLYTLFSTILYTLTGISLVLYIIQHIKIQPGYRYRILTAEEQLEKARLHGVEGTVLDANTPHYDELIKVLAGMVRTARHNARELFRAHQRSYWALAIRYFGRTHNLNITWYLQLMLLGAVGLVLFVALALGLPDTIATVPLCGMLVSISLTQMWRIANEGFYERELEVLDYYYATLRQHTEVTPDGDDTIVLPTDVTS